MKHIFILLLFFDISNSFSQNLQQRKIVENSFSIIKNSKNIIPIQNLDQKKFFIAGLDKNTKNFVNSFKRYSYLTNEKEANIFIFLISNKSDFDIYKHLIKPLKKDIIFIVFNISDTLFIENLKKMSNTIISTNINDSLTYDYAAQFIFGAFNNYRFKYTIPSEIGIDSNFLFSNIDSIISDAIRTGAFPGCQIFAAINKKVIFYKCYGYADYDSLITVNNEHIYDLASITKIAASAAALMYLYQKKYFSLDDSLSEHIRFFKNSNKSNIKIIDALTHQAKLKPYIPFWKSFVDNDFNLNNKYFDKNKNHKYKNIVGKKIYSSNKTKKIVYETIIKSELLDKNQYKYSDLFFYIVPNLVKNKSKTDFEDYLNKNFYSKLGANTLCFNPISKFDSLQIVPTEYDSLFRKQLIWGTVHDEGAALMGGISGHAGLFGNANDLAKIMQMFIDNGVYGNEKYLDSSIVIKWTSYQNFENGNHRGIVFDKPLFENKQRQTASEMASDRSFGHSGFTGTFTWADPEYNFVFVFLSNRVYPSRNNNKITQNNIRTKIHDVFYQALNQRKKN